MKINKISVENLGIYKDYWEFDLSAATHDKPIVLFGGLNGAGKTTLFDGIRLCLYGKGILKGISEAAYQDYLKDKIHRPNSIDAPLDSASVELIFEFAEDGKINEYKVRRSWKQNRKSIAERLEVYKNNRLFDGMQENLWQDFINELIPIGVSQLFFSMVKKSKILSQTMIIMNLQLPLNHSSELISSSVCKLTLLFIKIEILRKCHRQKRRRNWRSLKQKFTFSKTGSVNIKIKPVL